MNFKSEMRMPTHRLVDGDIHDKCIPVLDVISAKKYACYLVEITSDGYMVHCGKIEPEPKIVEEPKAVDELKKKDKKK
jgi:hypothetical protein